MRHDLQTGTKACLEIHHTSPHPRDAPDQKTFLILVSMILKNRGFQREQPPGSNIGGIEWPLCFDSRRCV